MNGYKVCSFQSQAGKEFLVLDVFVSDMKNNQIFVQGFTFNRCYPFPLFVTVKNTDDELLEEVLIDGTNYVKDIEKWSGEEIKEELQSLILNTSFLQFIRDNCKSEKLAADIDGLIN